MKLHQPGDVLYFYPEALTIMVVMASEEGIRYIEPMNPEVDDNGNTITRYISNESLCEWTMRIGSIENMAEILINKD